MLNESEKRDIFAFFFYLTPFTVKYNVSCWFSVDVLHQVEEVYFCSLFGEDFFFLFFHKLE